MRTVGKVCAWVASIMLVLQGVLVFMGRSLSGVTVGLELLALAACFITDAFYYFKKPAEPHTELEVTYCDGSKRIIVSRPGASSNVTSSSNNPVTDISITYFLSER